MATQNGSTLSTVNTAWKGRATAPAPTLQVLTKQAAVSLTTNGTGAAKDFFVAHGLDKWPNVVVLESGHANSAAAHDITVDETNIYIHFPTAPPADTGNVKFTGMAAY